MYGQTVNGSLATAVELRMKNIIIKRPEQLILLLAIVLLTPEVFAQSGHMSDNVEYRFAAPLLPDGKNPVLGSKYTAKEESFIFGIIADRAGGNPLIGWPYFEEAVRTMNVADGRDTDVINSGQGEGLLREKCSIKACTDLVCKPVGGGISRGHFASLGVRRKIYSLRTLP